MVRVSNGNMDSWFDFVRYLWFWCYIEDGLAYKPPCYSELFFEKKWLPRSLENLWSFSMER